jgi:hypothetical protein
MQLLRPFYGKASIVTIPPIPKLCAAGYFQVFEENTELQIAEGGNTVSNECEAIVIKFFGRNYLINGSIRYFFCLRGAMTKLLRYWGRREPRKFGNRWTILWARQLRNWCSIPGRNKGYFSSPDCQTGSGMHPTSHSMGVLSLFHGIKQPASEADHSTPT